MKKTFVQDETSLKNVEKVMKFAGNMLLKKVLAYSHTGKGDEEDDLKGSNMMADL